MELKLSRGKYVFIALIPIILFTTLWYLINSEYFVGNQMALAVSIDLLLVIPLIYFLLIRKTDIPKTTVIPVVLIGFVFGTLFIPKEEQTYLELFKLWVLPVLELGIISFVIYKVRKAVLSYRRNKNVSPDFFAVLKQSCSEIVPNRLATPLATEIAVFYYGFIDWKARKLDANEFSYHKKNGSQALMFGIVLVIAVETYVLHILLLKWSEIAAYLVTFLSIYTGLQFIGFAKSISKRPIKIESDRLVLRYGMVNEAVISFENIESIEASTKDLDEDKLTKRFSLLGELEPHNVVLKVKDIQEFQSIYGIKRKFQTLAFYVDDVDEFVGVINQTK